MAALLAVLPLLGLVFFLCSCSGSAPPSQDFRYDLRGQIDTLDPQFALSEASKVVILNCFEGLVRFDSNGELQSGAASQYQLSGDYKKYVFTISPGARWSDGSAVTADDFLFAFERIFSPGAPSPYAGEFAIIKNSVAVLAGELPISELGVYTDGPSRLIFELEEPSSFFPTLLTGAAAMPCKRSFFTDQRGRYGMGADELISNGRFKVSGIYQTRLVLRPAEHHESPTSVTSLTLHTGRQDSQPRFLAGQTDFLLGAGYPAFGSDYNYNNFYDRVCLLIFNQQESPYGSAEVRRALISALDFDAIAALLGEGRYAADGIVPPGAMLLGHSYRELAGVPLMPTLSEDARAQLFSEYAALDINALPATDLLLAEGRDMSIASSMQRSWQSELSAYINILPIPDQQLNSRVIGGNFKMALFSIAGGGSTPHEFLLSIAGYDSENITRSSIEGIGEQLESAAALSAELAASAYLESEELILSNFAVWPIYYTPSCFVSAPGVSGAYYLPQNGMIYFADAIRK